MGLRISHSKVVSSELPTMAAVQYNSHVIQTESRNNDTALPLVGVLVIEVRIFLLKMENY